MYEDSFKNKDLSEQKIMDDIPEALREEIRNKKQRSQVSLKIIILVGLGLVVCLSLVTGSLLLNASSTTELVKQEETIIDSSKIEPTPIPSPVSIPQPDNILGHLEYVEASRSDLKPITRNGSIMMRKAAADKFLQMQGAARANGISLVPISGFRTIDQQNYLFFGIKEQRAQDTLERAEVSAPPGYSEHHTGYAIDIGDGRIPATNLSPEFEKTPAFRWLEKNAAKYSFELSFPKDNLQGISYEPWHWRFVGNSHSLETFYKARHLQQPLRNK